jgi:hypothetical protein
MRVKITRSAPRHNVGKAHIVAALDGAELIVFHAMPARFRKDDM